MLRKLQILSKMTPRLRAESTDKINIESTDLQTHEGWVHVQACKPRTSFGVQKLNMTAKEPENQYRYRNI